MKHWVCSCSVEADYRVVILGVPHYFCTRHWEEYLGIKSKDKKCLEAHVQNAEQ